MLGPSIDEDNNIEYPSCLDAIMHNLSIGWKLIFALIPPRRYWGGKLAFIISLAMIGILVIIVEEFANLLGCVAGIEPEVTAISLVALGTSLPDTFASKTAAENSEHADSAIGNITGSNSVNVFLGLGITWTIGAIYEW